MDLSDPLTSAGFKTLEWFASEQQRFSRRTVCGTGYSHTRRYLQVVRQSFTHPDIDRVFAESLKVAQDDNGGTVESGDSITYTITLRNGGGLHSRNVKIGDLVASAMKIDDDAWCLDCVQNESLTCFGQPIRCGRSSSKFQPFPQVPREPFVTKRPTRQQQKTAQNF